MKFKNHLITILGLGMLITGCNPQKNPTVTAAFLASETLDIAAFLGSLVSFDYFEKAPFKFNGTINSVYIKLL
jgi:hypothetical protein